MAHEKAPRPLAATSGQPTKLGVVPHCLGSRLAARLGARLARGCALLAAFLAVLFAHGRTIKTHLLARHADVVGRGVALLAGRGAGQAQVMAGIALSRAFLVVLRAANRAVFANRGTLAAELHAIAVRFPVGGLQARPSEQSQACQARRSGQPPTTIQLKRFHKTTFAIDGDLNRIEFQSTDRIAHSARPVRQSKRIDCGRRKGARQETSARRVRFSNAKRKAKRDVSARTCVRSHSQRSRNGSRRAVTTAWLPTA